MYRVRSSVLAALIVMLGSAPSLAATIAGRVVGSGAPIANSTVTLWAAGAGDPQQLAQAQTGADGEFTMTTSGTPNASLYLLAKGGQPAAGVWVMNNWQDIDSCLDVPDEARSTRCGGQGVTIFFGMAKPVRAPQIGPARPY